MMPGRPSSTNYRFKNVSNCTTPRTSPKPSPLVEDQPPRPVETAGQIRAEHSHAQCWGVYQLLDVSQWSTVTKWARSVVGVGIKAAVVDDGEWFDVAMFVAAAEPVPGSSTSAQATHCRSIE